MFHMPHNFEVPSVKEMEKDESFNFEVEKKNFLANADLNDETVRFELDYYPGKHTVTDCGAMHHLTQEIETKTGEKIRYIMYLEHGEREKPTKE